MLKSDHLKAYPGTCPRWPTLATFERGPLIILLSLSFATDKPRVVFGVSECTPTNMRIKKCKKNKKRKDMLRYADDWALPFSCFASFLFIFFELSTSV